MPALDPDDGLPEPDDRDVEPVAPAPLVEDEPAPAAPELVAPPAAAPPPVDDEPLLTPDEPDEPDDPDEPDAPIDDSVPVTSTL